MKNKIDFMIFGKHGAGLRMLGGALGSHPKLRVSTEGLDGFDARRVYGEGDVHGMIVPYRRAHLLFNLKPLPPRVVHITRVPRSNAEEFLALRSSIAPNESLLLLTTNRIAQEQKMYRAKLKNRKSIEVFEVAYEDLMNKNLRVLEELTDFLFVHGHSLILRRLKDE